MFGRTQKSDESVTEEFAPQSGVEIKEIDRSEFFRDYENWRQENYFEKFKWVSFVVIGAFVAIATLGSNTEVSQGSLVPIENGASMSFEIPFLSQISLVSDKPGVATIADISQVKTGIFWVIKSTTESREAFDIMEDCATSGIVTTYYESEVNGVEQMHVILSRGFSSLDEAQKFKSLIPEQYQTSSWLALLDNTAQVKK